MKTCERCKQEQKEGEVLTYIDSDEWCWGCVEQTRHDAGKALMAKERQAIVAWLLYQDKLLRDPAASAFRVLADQINDGAHWKEAP